MVISRHTPQTFPVQDREPVLGRAEPRGYPDVASDLGEHEAQGGQTHRHIDPKSRCYRSLWKSRAGNSQLGLKELGRCL